MTESVIVIGAILLAAAGVIYGLYRTAKGQSGCAGCKGCGEERTTCQFGQDET